MLARQHIVIQLLFVIEAQRSAARIVVSFRQGEKRLFLTLADRLFVRLSAAKEEKQLKMKLKTFRFLLLPLSGCAFRPACSIWQKNKRKATRATKTTVPSSWNPPMLPLSPSLLAPPSLCGALQVNRSAEFKCCNYANNRRNFCTKLLHLHGTKLRLESTQQQHQQQQLGYQQQQQLLVAR